MGGHFHRTRWKAIFSFGVQGSRYVMKAIQLLQALFPFLQAVPSIEVKISAPNISK
jgi:hypothetical protein